MNYYYRTNKFLYPYIALKKTSIDPFSLVLKWGWGIFRTQVNSLSHSERRQFIKSVDEYSYFKKKLQV